jgi:Ca2+:H+ antiporter
MPIPDLICQQLFCICTHSYLWHFSETLSYVIQQLYFQFYSHNHLFLDTLQTTPSSNRSFFTRSSTMNTVVPLPTVSPAVVGVHLRLNTPTAIFLLFFSTGLAYPTADHLVTSLQGLVAAHPNISKEWITLIVIPIISNAAEHTTAVVVARRGKFDLAMSVAVGSCVQIALFVIPMLILIAWGMDKPLTLLFDPLETIVRT